MKTLGRWISDGSGKPFYVRRELNIAAGLAKAVIHACGLGQFELFLNGHKVGDHELDPGWSDYRKLVGYVTFDVTDMLTPGWNVLIAGVGNGWYHWDRSGVFGTDPDAVDEASCYSFHFPPFMPPNPNPYEAFGRTLVFACEIVLTYEGGQQAVIACDDRWLTAPHEVTMSNIYGSETIDGRKIPAGLHTVFYDQEQWKKARIVSEDEEPKGGMTEQYWPPVKVIHTYEAQRIAVLHPAELTSDRGIPFEDPCARPVEAQPQERTIYDLGQNISGLLHFRVKGHAGDIIHIYPAEKLTAEGDVDQLAKGWIPINSVFTYIVGSDARWEDVRMHFTCFAGRYLGVECESRSAGCAFRDLAGEALTSAWEESGSFTCDDDCLNQIYQMIERTVEANMTAGVHTDCPTIERFAWQEPNHLMAPSIMYMKRSDALWRKFLADLRLAQHKTGDTFRGMDGSPIAMDDGLVPSQAPCYIPNVLPVPGLGDFYDIIPWGSTLILGTMWHYRFYGDVQMIRDNYAAGLRYLEHLKRKVNADGFLNYGLGDWGNPENNLARENVETAFLYADAMTLARFAEILADDPDGNGPAWDYSADQKNLLAYAKSVRANYNGKLLVHDEERGFWCYRVFDHPDEIFLTQAAEAIPLYFGMVPEDREEDVVRAFEWTLREKGAFISGEVGLPYIIQTASKYGMDELIMQFITRREHPSYYAFILDGETTLGEYWEKNPRSHCHDMMGHIIEWYYADVAGIRPAAPGFAKIRITPYLPQKLHYVRAGYRSVHGRIDVQIEEQEDGVWLSVKTPVDVPCKIDTSKLEAENRGPVRVFMNGRMCE